MGTSMEDWIDATLDQQDNPGDPVWEEDPVDFETFASSERHLGLSPFSEIQRRDLRIILGDDPKLTFSGGSKVNVGVLMWGKGSGKDWICAFVQTYAIYLLLCMRNPTAFFKLDKSHWLDCINACVSKGNAQAIYWEYFQANIEGWPWLRDRYTIVDERGKLKDLEGNKKGHYPLKITTGYIEFRDKRIRASSKGSDAKVSEGFAPIVWTMDEASAFKEHTETMNAEKLYSTFKTSAATRYGAGWKGFIISFPRDKYDFTVTMYNKAVEDGVDTDDKTQCTLYGSAHATWEVRPPGSFSKETFDFPYRDSKGVEQIVKNIPVIPFWQQFKDSPEDSLRMLAVIAPETSSPFFQYPERILECVNPKRIPLFLTETCEVTHNLKDETRGGRQVVKNYIGKKITTYLDRSKRARTTPYVIHVDGGRDKDSAALCMAHGEPMTVQVQSQDDNGKDIIENVYKCKVIVDALLIWKPDKKRKLQVSFNNIETLIIELKKVYNIVKVSYDQWQSQSSLEMLQSKHILSEEHTINDDDYGEARTAMYQQGFDILPQVIELEGRTVAYRAAEVLYGELLRLKDTGKRVDHPKNGSKDLADCLIGVNRLLNEEGQMEQTREVTPPRAILGAGLMMGRSMPFSPANMGVSVDVPDVVKAPRSKTPQTGMMTPGYGGFGSKGMSSKQNGRFVPNVEQGRTGYGNSMPRPVLVGGRGRINMDDERFFNGPGSIQRGMLPRRLSK